MNFEFLCSDSFEKVSESEFFSVIRYFRNYAFVPITEPIYDKINHKVFSTYKLSKHHWSFVYGTTEDNPIRALGYIVNEEFYLWKNAIGVTGVCDVAA